MAEDGDLMKAFKQGLSELQAANEGKMAMGAPPIVEAPAAEAPAAESPSYVEAINRQSEMSETRSVEPEGMSR